VVALRAGSATDVGNVRSNNQDSLLTSDPLFAVADGMGGAAAGEVASRLAVEALDNGFFHSGQPTADLLMDAAQAANRAVWDEAEANPEMRGMGTTLVAIALVEGPQLAIINIGDSRLYVLHDGELRQITSDHNLVAEMVAEGRITPAEAEVHPRRNIMTRALGVEPEVPIDLFVEDPVDGDRYLLCSDGLPREVNDDLIASLLRRIGDPSEAAKELVEEAKRRGGNDNITVVVVDVVGDGVEDDTTVLPVKPEPVVTEAPVEPSVRREDERPARSTRSPVTLRVVVFLLLFIIILLGAVGGVIWYARSSYFVGLRGNDIVVYQGRPGGVLGMNPTLKSDTGYTTGQVLPSALPALQSGQEEPSVSAAFSYVANLVGAWQTAQAAAGATTTTTTTAPPRATTTTRRPAPTTAKP
jgi:serine/threonine protein phosphatase PrpC